MPLARKAIPIDATWIVPLWNRAAPLLAPYYPGAQTIYTAANALADIQNPGQQFIVSPESGFMIYRPGRLPERPATVPGGPPGGLASEIVIWMQTPGQNQAKFTATARPLFLLWLQDNIARAEFEYGFAERPLDFGGFAKDFGTAWNLHTTDFERGGKMWRRWWYRFNDALVKLP